MDFIVESATTNDIPRLIEFQLLMAQESEGLELDQKTLAKGIEHIFQHPDLGYYLAVRKDGQLVACCLMQKEWSDWRCKTVLWLHSLYVEPAYRRQGIWRKIYDYLREMIDQDPSLAGLRLYVDTGNERAIQAYKGVEMDDQHYRLFEYLK